MAYDSAVYIDDGDAKAFTAFAGGSILAGDLVYPISGANTFNSVGSRHTTFDGKEIVVVAGSSAAVIKQLCVGLAMVDASSGNEVSVMKRGIVILPAGSNGIAAGKSVYAVGYGVGGAISHNNACVEDLTAGAGSVFPIGKSLNSATANAQFAVISLNI